MSVTYTKKYCVLCGKEYNPKSKRCLYCSDECRKIGSSRRATADYLSKPKKKTHLSIEEVSRLAKEQGETYGSIVQKLGI